MDAAQDNLERLCQSLHVTQRRNDELLGALDEIALELERVDNIYDTVPLLNVVGTLREALSETIKPNQNAGREFGSLTKLLEARLIEIKGQEKHNESQILAIEKDRRDVKAQKAHIDEQRRLLSSDKERMEQKIDQERSELLARAQELSSLTKVISPEPESLEKSVIQEAERSSLKSELSVLKKSEEIKGLETMCGRYHGEIKKVRDEAREAVKISENQAMEACKRLKQMNAELVKSQETARKFQEFLVVERERNKSLKAHLDHERLQPIGKHIQSSLVGADGPEGSIATIPGLSRAMIQRAAKNKQIPIAVRVETLLKKNESLRKEQETTEEALKTTQQEYNKVKEECKSACNQLHYSSMQASTMKQSTEDALQKLKTIQQKYNSLNKSLVKEPTSYVQENIEMTDSQKGDRFVLPNVTLT